MKMKYYTCSTKSNHPIIQLWGWGVISQQWVTVGHQPTMDRGSSVGYYHVAMGDSAIYLPTSMCRKSKFTEQFQQHTSQAFCKQNCRTNYIPSKVRQKFGGGEIKYGPKMVYFEASRPGVGDGSPILRLNSMQSGSFSKTLLLQFTKALTRPHRT